MSDRPSPPGETLRDRVLAAYGVTGDRDAPIVVLPFETLPRRERVAVYLRGLRRPRMFLPLAFVALMPVLGDRVLAALIPSGPLGSWVVVGPLGVAFVIALGVLTAYARSSAPFTISFSRDGIRVSTDGHVEAHPWSWICDVDERPDRVTLRCERAAFRFGRSPAARELVLDPAAWARVKRVRPKA